MVATRDLLIPDEAVARTLNTESTISFLLAGGTKFMSVGQRLRTTAESADVASKDRDGFCRPLRIANIWVDSEAREHQYQKTGD